MSSGRASDPVKTTDTVTFDTTDARTVRPYKGLLVLCVPTKGYTSCFDTTDALPLDTIVRPDKGLLVLCVPTTTSLAVVALCLVVLLLDDWLYAV